MENMRYGDGCIWVLILMAASAPQLEGVEVNAKPKPGCLLLCRGGVTPSPSLFNNSVWHRCHWEGPATREGWLISAASLVATV